LQKKEEEDEARSLVPESRQSVAEKLEKLGFSRLESKIYLELFMNGPRKASTLSKTLEVNRVDVYRSIKRLRQRGILELTFTRPLSFSAVEPDTLTEALISEREIALRAFKKELDALRKDLASLPRSQLQRSRSEMLEVIENTTRRGAQFQLKYGRQIFEKWKKMVEGAKEEMMIILSHVGLMTHSIEGFSELYARASKRGISVKMITDVSAENYDQALEFSKTCSLKVSNNVNEILRYVISDDREAMISGGYFSNDPREFTAICTNNTLMIKALRLDFKDKWKRSKQFHPKA
jgi:sugar-specific transcriptional regulator TrmB